MTKGEESITKGEGSITKDEGSITKDEGSVTKGERSITKGEGSITKDDLHTIQGTCNIKKIIVELEVTSEFVGNIFYCVPGNICLGYFFPCLVPTFEPSCKMEL